MFLNKKAATLLMFALIIKIICFLIWYFISTWKNISIITITNSFERPISSLNYLCHPPNGSKFIHNRLRQLIVANMENKSAYINESDASKIVYISQNYSTLAEFMINTRIALISRRVITLPNYIYIIFHNPPLKHMVRPSCDGLWMEFGVYQGATLTRMANWKKTFCGNTSQPVYGFDTFSGLPTNWRPGFDRGTFQIPNGTVLSIPSNAVLVKGLFIDTLPNQLRLFDREYQCHTPVSTYCLIANMQFRQWYIRQWRNSSGTLPIGELLV
jgi:hypothetical protein